MSPFISSGALGVRDVRAALKRCRDAGITHLELASGLECPGDQWALVEEASDDMSFLLHNYFPAPVDPFVLNLAALDDDMLERSLAFCRRAIDLSQRINAPFYSTHAGFALPLTPSDLGNPEALKKKAQPGEVQRATAMARFKSSVQSLSEYAAKKNVILLLENNVVAGNSFVTGADHGLLLVDSEEICDFFTSLNLENIGLLADVGHAKVSAQTLGFDLNDWLEKVQPFIRAFHLSDNDGQRDNNQVFDGSAWFMPQLQSLDETPRVIEVYNIDDETINDLMVHASSS